MKMFHKKLILKDNVSNQDIFLPWSKTHKFGLSMPGCLIFCIKVEQLLYNFPLLFRPSQLKHKIVLLLFLFNLSDYDLVHM